MSAVYGFLMSKESPAPGYSRQPVAKVTLTEAEVAICMVAVSRFWNAEKDTLLVIEARGENRRVCGAENVFIRGREWNIHRAPKGFVWDRNRDLPIVEE